MGSFWVATGLGGNCGCATHRFRVPARATRYASGPRNFRSTVRAASLGSAAARAARAVPPPCSARGSAGRPLVACRSMGREVLCGRPASGPRDPWGHKRRGGGRSSRRGTEGGTPGHLALLGVVESVGKGSKWEGKGIWDLGEEFGGRQRVEEL